MRPAPWLDTLRLAVATRHARSQYVRFLTSARHGTAVQDRLLKRLVESAATSDFGRDHGFDRIRNYEGFAEQVPIRTYEGLQPYVERAVRGDAGALFAPGRRILMFAMTSGSTNRPKFVPITREFLREYRRGWNVFGVKALLDHPEGFLRPILQVVSPMDEQRTENGVPCGSISGLLAATAKPLVRKYYVNPAATGAIDDPEARYYAIMRFAVPRDVAWMVTASPATAVKLARSAATHAERLIRDVHDGTLSPPGDAPTAVINELRSRLSPEPETARNLTALAQQCGELLPNDYWNLSFLANWTGGTLALHLRDFPHYFGGTPVRDIGLLATEGRVCIPLEDGTAAGVLDVAGTFFEFVDAEADSTDRSAVHRANEVSVGREYRVIMTTHAGFFRYDIEDRVIVRGFLGEAPIVEFLHRGAHVSSMSGEKLTEWQVTTAYRLACDACEVPALEFVLAPVWGDPPFYRLHVEGSSSLASSLTRTMDSELARLNMEYASRRASERLGPLVMNRLPRKFLAAWIMDRQSRWGAANEQFKHQYLLNVPGEARDFRLEQVNSSRRDLVLQVASPRENPV